MQIYTCNQTGAQNWTVQPDGTIRLLGSCLDATGGGTSNGTLVELYSCNGTGAQQWHATTSGQLINTHSGLCLDDPNSSTTPGTQLQLYGCDNTAAQKWTLPS